MMQTINRASCAFYYMIFVHLILVFVGWTLQETYTAPACSESMPPCVWIAGTNESVWSIAGGRAAPPAS